MWLPPPSLSTRANPPHKQAVHAAWTQLPAFLPLLHLLLLSLSFLPASCGRLVAPKPCPGPCQHDGNCNHELGVCECNFGWNGPTCEHPLLGACRSSDSPTALVMYGRAWPKSCQCWRQLLNHSQGVHHIKAPRSQWLGLGQPGFPEVMGIQEIQPAFVRGNIKYCYERDGVPPDRQFSDVPLLGEAGVKYFAPGNASGVYAAVAAPEQILTADDKPIFPLRMCPDRCHDRGACVTADNAKQPSCRCRKGFMGPSCGQADNRTNTFIFADAGDKSCLRNCNGIGRCLAGFCSCPAGYWGLDCSRSKVYEQQPGEKGNSATACAGLSRPQLRIYRYELPWFVTFPHELDDGWPTYDLMYSAFERFFEAFGGDWAVRTEDPSEAHLFYVPLLPMYHLSRHQPHQQVWQVMQYIKEQYPELWGRNQGKDHFMWMTGDVGACHLRNDPLVQAPIKLVHWGLQLPKAQYSNQVPGTCAWDGPPGYCCYLDAKDVVAPCTDVPNNSGEYKVEHWEQALDVNSPDRKNLLYFGGGLRLNAPAYSGGARQAFHQHVLLRNDSRVQFGGAPDQYQKSTFCFCPYGDGWGNRLPHIVLGGCVPVIVQEHVHQPFDDLLPYEEFSLNLRVQDMPQLLEILEAVPRERIQQYRQKLYQYRKAFYWYGDGEAYNMTLKSLRRRAYKLCGNQYRRTYRRGD